MSLSIAFIVIKTEKKYKILILFYFILVILNGHSKGNAKVEIEDQIIFDKEIDFNNRTDNQQFIVIQKDNKIFQLFPIQWFIVNISEDVSHFEVQENNENTKFLLFLINPIDGKFNLN